MNDYQFSYLQHCVVFILSCAVVCMEVDRGLLQSMVAKKEVEHADDGIGSLSGHHSFIYQEVHLDW